MRLPTKSTLRSLLVAMVPAPVTVPTQARTTERTLTTLPMTVSGYHALARRIVINRVNQACLADDDTADDGANAGNDAEADDDCE